MYRPEHEEILRSPDWMMRDLETQGYVEGDCDDIAIFLAALIKVLGNPVHFVAIRTKAEDPEFSHVFVEVWTGNGWTVMDPTVPHGTRYRTVERMIENV